MCDARIRKIDKRVCPDPRTGSGEDSAKKKDVREEIRSVLEARDKIKTKQRDLETDVPRRCDGVRRWRES